MAETDPVPKIIPLESASFPMIRSGVQLLNWGLLLKVTLYAVLFAWLIYQLIGILPQQENPDEKPSPEVVAKVEALQPIIQQLVFVITLIGLLINLVAYRKFRLLKVSDQVQTTTSNLWYCAWLELGLLSVLIVLAWSSQHVDSVPFRGLSLMYQIIGCGVLMFLASYFQLVSQRLLHERLLEFANRLWQLALLFSIFSTYVNLVFSTLPFKHEVPLQAQEPNAFVSLASPMLLASLFAGAWGLYVYYRWQRLAMQLLNPPLQNQLGSS